MNRSVEDRLRERIDHIEAAYEFMLAYAAQGVTGEEEGGSATEIRVQLKRSEEALEGLAALAEELVATGSLKPTQPYRSFYCRARAGCRQRTGGDPTRARPTRPQLATHRQSKRVDTCALASHGSLFHRRDSQTATNPTTAVAKTKKLAIHHSGGCQSNATGSE